jgi:hypothetical protein
MCRTFRLQPGEVMRMRVDLVELLIEGLNLFSSRQSAATDTGGGGGGRNRTRIRNTNDLASFLGRRPK